MSHIHLVANFGTTLTAVRAAQPPGQQVRYSSWPSVVTV